MKYHWQQVSIRILGIVLAPLGARELRAYGGCLGAKWR